MPGSDLFEAERKARQRRAEKYAAMPRGRSEARAAKIALTRGGELVEYAGYGSPSLFHCEKGHEFTRTMAQLAKDYWCPICDSYDSYRYYQMQFAERVRARGGLVRGTYKHSHTPVLIECAHGHQWDARPSDVQRGRWCPECSDSTGTAAERISEIARERGIDMVSYVNARSPILLQCAARIYEVKYPNFHSGLTWCKGCDCRATDASGKPDYTVRCVTDYETEHTFLYLGAPPAPLPIHLGPLFEAGETEDYYDWATTTRLTDALYFLKSAIRESADDGWKVVNVWGNPQWIAPGEYTWGSWPLYEMERA